MVRNSQVKAAKANWQRCLNSAGYVCGTVDGIFGSNTEKQTKLFQQANSLTQDGKAGYDTKMAMWNTINVPSVCVALNATEIVGND